jgi:peptide/nickel transport system ATP-binding protein
VAAPRLLIADEPTTALDVTIQAQILDLLLRIVSNTGMTLLLITHDMGVVARVCNRVAVMYAGEIVEEATVDDLFRNPLHPYTRALLECLPDPTKNRRQVKSIPGSGEPLDGQQTGCRFRSRCAFAREVCSTHPELLGVASQRAVRCWVSQEEGRLPEVEESAAATPEKHREVAIRPQRDLVHDGDGVVLTMRAVSRRYSVRGGALRAPRQLLAVDDVTLDVLAGETLGIVGESGSGKSTLAKLMVGLEKPTSGSVTITTGEASSSDSSDRPFMVFQDPDTSLDPRMKVGTSVGEPLIEASAQERRERVKEMLRLVGLDEVTAQKYPHQLSGGQQQRACIARAVIAGTKVIVLDEALSSLDASMQARMINLLDELKAALGLTYVFISHNLSVVDAIADRTCVMYLGKIVELGPATGLRAFPLHPYTVALHAAVPAPNPEFERQRERLILRGEIGSSLNLPGGCRFHPRCPLATDLCRVKEPETVEYRPGHWAACHFSGEWSTHRDGDAGSLLRRLLAA